MRDGFWRRNAWRFLLALAAVIVLFGAGDLALGLDADAGIPLAITGMSIDQLEAAEPAASRLADVLTRSGGVHLLVMGILWSTILLVPFRRGERWAWWAMWTFPAWALSVSVSMLFVEFAPGTPPPPPAISGWVFFGLTAALLLAAAGGIPGPAGFGPATVTPARSTPTGHPSP